MDINSKTFDEFRADFNAGIAPLQDKYDVTITLGRITYYEEYWINAKSRGLGRKV